MLKQPTEEELKELADQLSCPTGDVGGDVALRMNESNKNLTIKCYDELVISAHNKVLEAGPGNGLLALPVIESIQNLGYYTGVDVSPQMIEECLKNSNDFKNCDFFHSPFDKKFSDNLYDRFICVNVLYFVKDLDHFIEAIKINLDRGARGVIGIRSQETLRKLPVTKYKFIERSIDEITNALKQHGLKNVQVIDHHEDLKTKRQIDVHFSFHNYIITFER